jgi:hypothetical protein
MSGNQLCEIATAVSRLKFKVQSPDEFYEERRRIVGLLKVAATPSPCTTCPVRGLEFQLDEKRRQVAWERRQREEAEAREGVARRERYALQRALDEAIRMLRQLPRPRRRARVPIEGQLALFDHAAGAVAARDGPRPVNP